MTIREAIDRIDDLKHNTYTDHDKLLWLGALESMIHQTVTGNADSFAPFDDTTPMDTPLLAQPPYEQLYLYYLGAQMDYYNEEYDRCNNALGMFRALFEDFRAFCNRARPRGGQKLRYF